MELSSTTFMLIAGGVLLAVLVSVLWRKPQLPDSVSLGSAAAIVLVVLIGVAAMVSLLHETGPSSGAVYYPTGNVIALVAVMGALGGLLAAHTQGDRGLVWPHKRGGDTPSYEFGIIGDILLGVGGAIVVFVTVPGEPAAKIAESSTEMLRFLAFAVIGGFGARALLEQTLSQRVAAARRDAEEAKRAVAETKAREQRGAEALKRVQSQLSGNTQSTAEEFVALFRDLPPDVPPVLFQRAKQFRSESRRSNKRAEIPNVLPVMQALQTLTIGAPEHELAAEIAYVAFDREPPDYAEALRWIERAITLRGAASTDVYRYEIIEAVSLVHAAQANPADAALEARALKALNGLKARQLRIEGDHHRALVNGWSGPKGGPTF